MKRTGLFWSWLWTILGILYFFLPLLATFMFSLRATKGILSFKAYTNLFAVRDALIRPISDSRLNVDSGPAAWPNAFF